MIYPIIPKPQSIASDDTEVFTLTRFCEIEGAEKFPEAVSSLKKFLDESFGIILRDSGKEKISLLISDETSHDEGYALSVRENRVIIKGKTGQGIFYGIQTLNQMLMYGNLTLCRTEITDEPTMSYRGFMLDCARYFFSKEAVFVFLEIMALHKLNCFHWHLTDDQGWRFYSENHLLLTEIGSYRSHTNFGSVPHSGYYTREDIKEIVGYAHSLFIRVIPEIDSPGHTVSAIAAYPFLSCFDRELVTETKWGIKHDILCAGKESTYEFMYSLLDDVIDCFPDGIIHIGGNDVPTARWEICPHCRKRMKDEGLEDVNELHSYYLDRISSYLKSKGVEVIMWSDKARGCITDSSVIRQLHGTDTDAKDITEETDKGVSFIISPQSAYCLDMPYGRVSLEECYKYDPVPEEITEENRHLIKGVEACMWTEFVPSMEKAGYFIFPRLGAIAEAAWTKKENRDYDSFLSRLEGYYSHLDAINLDYAGRKKALPGTVGKFSSSLSLKKRKLYEGRIFSHIDNKNIEKKYRKKDQND